MSLLGKGALVIWNDVASGSERELDRWHIWHIKEHMPERLAVPGFLRGRRYTANSDHPRCFTCYETASVATLGSPPYLARLNDLTPWSRELFPLWRNTTRAACRVTASLGQGIGGCVATVELGPQPRRDEDLRGWLTELVLPRLVEHQDVVAAHLCEADVAVSQISTEEKRDRGGSDAVARWVVLVEGSEAEPVSGVCDEFLAVELLRQHGGTPGLERDLSARVHPRAHRCGVLANAVGTRACRALPSERARGVLWPR
jgi:hypothetical protein